MQSPNVRYIVHKVEDAVAFYTGLLGFHLDFQPGPGFAVVSHDGIRLALNAVGGPGGASQPMADGRVPEPGGWSRIMVETDDLDRRVADLKAGGVRFRSDVVNGM